MAVPVTEPKEPFWLDWLTNERPASTHLSLPSHPIAGTPGQCWGYCFLQPYLTFYVKAGYTNSEPLIYTESILTH